MLVFLYWVTIHSCLMRLQDLYVFRQMSSTGVLVLPKNRRNLCFSPPDN